MSDTLQLAKDLIARRSLTPDDAGCQDILIERLEKLGFKIERMRFGNVDNFWAPRCGAYRAGGELVQPAVRADHSRWHAVWTRRGRHENFHRGFYHRHRDVSRAAPETPWLDRPAHHLRRRGCGGGRHSARGGITASSR